ncbi:MAG: anthranilate synthase component I family protein [Flavobacteriales bacterium Tduv]
MPEFTFKTIQKKRLADSVTPVALYLKLRDRFPNTLLLECSDYHTTQNNASILCINPISEFIIDQDQARISHPDGCSETLSIKDRSETKKLLKDFLKSFKAENLATSYSGLYGYTSYDSVQHFETIQLNVRIQEAYRVPEVRLGFYSNLIVFHHFYNELSLIEHRFSETKSIPINQLIDLIDNRNFCSFSFEVVGDSTSNMTDDEHKKMIDQGIKACFRGEVFQIVLSRQFRQKFKGDEFNVYRELRRINPSPYLFYFDYGDYKIFGSSPESQLIVKDQTAYIAPIAGTIRRSGDDEKDKQLAEYLAKDPKENAEHVMLVDLARNDLSINSSEVKVERFKEIQYFSHVLHMVSKVSGKFDVGSSSIKIFGDTFPAGTLSGAPKYRATELIDKIEKQHRGIYGGAVGFFGLDGAVNTAIIIRSFVSKNNTLFFQAGGGIVSDSKEENEVQEVKNKLMALFKAVEAAQKL